MGPNSREDGLVLERFVVGPMEVNCYVVSDADTKETCVIDPGADPARIKKFLDKNSLDLKFIINTHGHADHIGADGYFDSPVYIHSLDEDFLHDRQKNLSGPFAFFIKAPRVTTTLTDGEDVMLGGLTFKVIHTPGHTPGSISLKLEDVIFTGDTLFAGGIGRTDFAYGDEAMLLKSIRERLLVFPDSTIIYPGHGDSSTIGEERSSNPFLSAFL